MSETLAYFFAILTIGSAMHLLLERILNPGAANRNSKADKRLSPTEVAYLAKEGDGGFALFIIVFDVMHREIKDKIAGAEIEKLASDRQKPYELALRKVAGSSLKDWYQRKVEMVTSAAKMDPVRFVTRVPVVYKFMRKGVQGLVHEVLRDPRNVKKFISVPGLMRLAADIGATGYRATLAQELKEQLTDEGFLASDETRHHAIKILLYAVGMCQIMLLTLILLIIPSPWHAILIYLGALFAAFIVHACTGAREFIPLYSDLNRALAQVDSDNIRVTCVRFVLSVMTAVLNIFSGVVFVLFFGTGSFMLYQAQAVDSVATYLMLVAQMAVQFICFSYLAEAFKLHVGEMPTRKARKSLAALRRKYPQEATLPALKAMLGENVYSQELSFLIALYGLETLFLI